MLELPIALFTATTGDQYLDRPNRGADCRFRVPRGGPSAPATTDAPRAAPGSRGAGEAARPRAEATAGGLVVAPVQPRRGEINVRVQGEVDLATAPRLQAVLEQAVSAVAMEARVDAPARDGVVPRVACDLDAVTFLCAAGLTVLHRVTALAATHRVDWVVFASTRPVRRIVGLTDLDRVVPLVTTTSPADDVHAQASTRRS